MLPLDSASSIVSIFGVTMATYWFMSGSIWLFGSQFAFTLPLFLQFRFIVETLNTFFWCQSVYILNPFGIHVSRHHIVHWLVSFSISNNVILHSQWSWVRDERESGHCHLNLSGSQCVPINALMIYMVSHWLFIHFCFLFFEFQF